VSFHKAVRPVCAIVGSVFVLLASGTLSAEGEPKENSPLSLSVRESVEIALRNNPLVRIAAEEKTVARGKITEARSAALPSLTASGQYTWLERLPSATFEGRTFTLGEQGQYVTSVNLQQTLYRAGRTAAGIRAAKLFETLTDQQLLDVQQTIAFGAEKAYYDVLLNTEFYAVSQDALDRARSYQSDVKKRHGQGMVSNYDLLRATIEVSNLQADEIKARNALNLARTSFLKTLTLPLSTEFVLADKLSYEPAEAQMDASLSVALIQRPDIKQADLQISIQREVIRATSADLYPSVSAVGTWEGGNASRFSFGGTGWDQGWYAGLMVSFPLFEGMRTKGKLLQERARLRQYDIRKEELLQSIELEVKQAILTLEDATEFVESQAENVKQAEEGLRLVEVRYDNEMATNLDVMDARLALIQARNNYVQAVYSHMLAKLSLKKAMGAIALP
jgi:outer membrane protein